MIVNGKLVTYDLSRFLDCQLKPVTICDLMRIPEFVEATEREPQTNLSDAWILETIHAIDLAYRQESMRDISRRRQNEIIYRRRLIRNAERRLRSICISDEH